MPHGLSRPEPSGAKAKAYRAFRDAGLSNEEAFRRATGKTAESVYSSKGTQGDALQRRLKKTRGY